MAGSPGKTRRQRVDALMRQAASDQVATADVAALAQRILGWCEEEYAQHR